MRWRLGIAVLASMIAGHAFAWGTEGHQVVNNQDY